VRVESKDSDYRARSKLRLCVSTNCGILSPTPSAKREEKRDRDAQCVHIDKISVISQPIKVQKCEMLITSKRDDYVA